MLRTVLYLLFAASFISFQNPIEDADALLKKVSARYQQLEGLNASFTLTVVPPKKQPGDDEMKGAKQIAGNLKWKREQFQLDLDIQQIWCNGKSIWTLLKKEKEVQLNDYNESDDLFSPTRIFTFYTQGFIYRTKETYTAGNKSYTVIELSPQNKKVSFFKIDLTVEDATLQIAAVKLYEKSGMRYLYQVTRQNSTSLSSSDFQFDAKKFPAVKLVDLR